MRKFLLALLVAGALSLVPVILNAGIPSKFHDFAQIADGGGFRTIFLIMNQNSESVRVTLELQRGATDRHPIGFSLTNCSPRSVYSSPTSIGRVRAAYAG